MGDTTDGSQNAAHGAPVETTPQDDTHISFLDWALRRRGRAPDVTPRPATDLDIASAAGARQMLVNLRKMGGLRVENVAIPRADIVAVSDDISLVDLMDVFRTSGYSRIPVFTETLDNPVGLIHLKDVALEHGFNGGKSAFELEPLMRPLLYAPPSMPVGALLQKMQGERRHMALVIDEYGGVDGLITMEDLVEQIVGEIADEHDADEDQEWSSEGEGVFRASARADLREFESVAGVDLLPDDLDDDVDTLGGLVFMLSGRVPVRGEVVRHPAGHEFEVLDADARRVTRMRVRLSSAIQASKTGKPRRAAE